MLFDITIPSIHAENLVQNGDGVKYIIPEKMAYLLGIPLERYKKYEKRTPLPHNLVERFVALTGASIEFLFTGSESTKRRDLAQTSNF